MLGLQERIKFYVCAIVNTWLLAGEECHCFFEVYRGQPGKVGVGTVFINWDGREYWVAVDHHCKSRKDGLFESNRILGMVGVGC